MVSSGASPQPPSRYRVPPFPVRRGLLMARRSHFVHNPKLPSCFHRLRILLFFSSTRSSYPCPRVAAVRYKSGRICAQQPFSVPHFRLRRSLYYLPPTFFHFRCISHFFFPSTRSSFAFLRVAVSYNPGRICAHLPLTVLQLHLCRSIYS
jgi:hypothetical protein